MYDNQFNVGSIRYLLGMIFIAILMMLLLGLMGCADTVTAVQQPEAKPTLVGLWIHDSQPLELDFQDGGTYTVTYSSLEGYGNWKPVPELGENVFEFSNDTLCRGASAYYNVIFTASGMRMFGQHDSCSGRLERWAKGTFTKRW